MLRRRRLPEIAVVLAALSFFASAYLFAKIQGEAKGRRSQTCRVFEGQHLQEVTELRKTYRFLTHTADGSPKPRSQWGDLEKFVFKELPKDEAEAKSDTDQRGVQVPEYCDEPGIGLPEPDPGIPARPESLMP